MFETRSLFAFIKQRMEADLSVTVPRLAAELGVGESTIKRCISANTGDSFTALRERLRAEKAQALLSVPFNSVQEVASLLGYRSADAFSRAFRKHSGTSPSRWRSRFAH